MLVSDNNPQKRVRERAFVGYYHNRQNPCDIICMHERILDMSCLYFCGRRPSLGGNTRCYIEGQ